MQEKAIRGVPWTLLTYAGSKGINIVTTVVLARLLVPSDFGLIALATLVINLVNAFRDFGLGGAFVLRRDLDERGQGTILSLLLGFGAAGMLLLAALSPLIADFFSSQRLGGILVAMSAVVLLGGFASFYETVLWRELEFRRRFIGFATQSVFYATIAISLAALGAGVWSMVVGQLVGWAVLCVALAALSPYRVRPAFDRASARATLAIGKGFLLQGGTELVQGNLDYLVVGRLLNANQVGYYSVGFRMSELPYSTIANPVGKVTFPAFSRMRHEGESLRQPFFAALRLVALIACPLAVLLSAVADPFVQALFGEKWLPMIGPIAVLGIWGAIKPLQATVGWLLNSVAEAVLMGIVSLAALVPLVPALFVAADLGGITAVAWVMVGQVLVSLLALGYFAARRADAPLRGQVRAIAPALIACLGAWLAARGAVELLSSELPLVALVGGLAAGLAAYALILELVERGILRTALGQIGRTLGRGPESPDREERVVAAP